MIFRSNLWRLVVQFLDQHGQVLTDTNGNPLSAAVPIQCLTEIRENRAVKKLKLLNFDTNQDVMACRRLANVQTLSSEFIQDLISGQLKVALRKMDRKELIDAYYRMEALFGATVNKNHD